MYFAVLKSAMPLYIHLAANGGISDFEDGKSFIKWFRKFDLFPCLNVLYSTVKMLSGMKMPLPNEQLSPLAS